MLRHSVVLGVKVAFLETRSWQRTVAALFLAGVFGLLGLADLAAAATNVGPVSGVVVDPAGKPAARAKVWLVAADDLPSTAADVGRSHHGREWQVSVARRQMGSVRIRTRHRRCWLPAMPEGARRDGGGHTALCERQSTVDHQDPNLGGPGIQGTHGRRRRQTDRQGVDRADGAVWRPRIAWRSIVSHLAGRNRERVDGRNGRRRPIPLQELPGVRPTFHARSAGEFGKALAALNLSKSVTIRLNRPGTLQLTATCPKDPKAVAGLSFFVITTSIDADPTEKGVAVLYYLQEVKTQEDGTFSLAKLPPGDYRVQPRFAASLPYCESGAISVVVKSGETAHEKVVLTPAVKVQGKVIDRATSKGVGGVHVAMFGEAAIVFRDAVTDDQGAFTIYVKPGPARFFCLASRPSPISHRR